MNTITIMIPGAAYEDTEGSFSDAAANGANPSLVGAHEAFLDAPKHKRGRGHSYAVTATVDQWWYIREELLYRWEMNGGNGNPYGVEVPAAYAATRRACKEALDRTAAALESDDGLQRIATTLHSLLGTK